MIDKQVLHYRIFERLGGGGMGEVYLARDTRLDRDVALKFLPDAVQRDDSARERLLREARSASKLSHPNIVSIHAIENDGEHDFIVMEYVAGRTLGALIKEDAVPLEDALEYARQICEALTAAHDAGLVHRDIKADNILVTPQGRVKVLDFGLAKVSGSVRLTQEGSTVGTMAYMSPEQVQGKEIDARSDLFSLGVLLYEMITRQLPFRGDQREAITYEILNQNPEPMARYKAEVPDEVQGIVDKLLRKDPSHRYPNAEGVLADLESHRSMVVTAERPAAKRKKGSWPIVAGAAVLIIPLIAVLMLLRNPGGSGGNDSGGRIMLAVLPFQNLGVQEDAYFADGVTEEITARLASLKGLGVIARTSVQPYENTAKSIQEIGKELGVDYVLEGTVRWQKTAAGTNRVRVTPQLIRVSDETHLWANIYDESMTQVFDVQSDIARQVATELGVALLEPEDRSLGSRPTENMQAYDFYLRGRDYYAHQTSLRQRDLALQMFEKAVELDPTFTLAQAWLARMYANDYFNNRNLEEPRLDQALEAARLALEHGPGRPEGHIAMGYYHYYASRNYEEALREFSIAAESQPNNGDLLEAMAYVQRRQGNFESAIGNLRRAIDIDPLSINKYNELANTLTAVRRYEETKQVLDRALAYAPDYWPLYVYKGLVELLESGDIEAAAHFGEEAIAHGAGAEAAVWFEQIDFFRRDFESVIRRRSRPSGDDVGNDAEYYLIRGASYIYLDQEERGLAYFDSARAFLESAIGENPNDHNLHMALGLAHAALGNRREAIEFGHRGLELLPIERDAMSGPELLYGMARIHALLGDYDEAVGYLEKLLSVPSTATPNLLKLDPVFDDMRDHPGFQRILRTDLKESS